MKTHNFPTTNPNKKMILFFFLILTISSSTNSARLLDEQLLIPTNSLEAFNPMSSANPAAPLSSIQPSSGVSASNNFVTSTSSDPQHILTFFMHDILGGSNPTARAVTGVVNNPSISGSLPFAKPNGPNLPLNNGVPQNNVNGGIIKNNNIPFLSGLGGSIGTSSMVQNNNGGNSNGFAVFSGGQLPQGATFQELMFGTMTVIDDELAEGPELGSGFLGKAQGFYVASSEEVTCQLLAFTAMFESGNYADSICFLGIHWNAVSVSNSYYGWDWKICQCSRFCHC